MLVFQPQLRTKLNGNKVNNKLNALKNHFMKLTTTQGTTVMYPRVHDSCTLRGHLSSTHAPSQLQLVSCPDSSPEKQKEGLVFWSTFLVTWGGAYGVKNVIFTFYIWDSSFLMIQTAVRHGLQRLDKAAKFSWESRERGSFFYLQFGSKYNRSLTSCTYNYAFQNLIRALRSGSYPAPCDKKSRSEHQTLFLSRTERGWARDQTQEDLEQGQSVHTKKKHQDLDIESEKTSYAKFLYFQHVQSICILYIWCKVYHKRRKKVKKSRISFDNPNMRQNFPRYGATHITPIDP